MPVLIETKSWECDKCRTAYFRKEQAEACELEHRTIDGVTVIRIGYKPRINYWKSGRHVVSEHPRGNLPDCIEIAFPDGNKQTYHYVPPKGL